MAKASAVEPANTRLFVLALGLLVGFVIGFVMLLAYIPVEDGLGDYQAVRTDVSSSRNTSEFDFYTVLADNRAEQIIAQPAGYPAEPTVQRPIATGVNNLQATAVDVRRSEPVQAVPAQVVIEPATRVVPGNALNLNQRNLAAESYAEISASNVDRRSYYLQAGNYRVVDDAERMRASVLLLGLEAFIVTREDENGGVGHRVRIGPFFDQQQLTEAKKRLRGGKVRYDIIRVTG